MKEMTKPKTPGTLLELRAMAYLYKRNILLYKPYDLGTWLVKELVFQQPFLRIFLAPPKHYDSVFTKSYIMKAAFCQGTSNVTAVSYLFFVAIIADHVQ